MNLSLLIHTFDRYAHLWSGYYEAFQENWNLLYPDSYFGSDIETENKVGPPFKMIYSGPGEWSDRLRRLLVKIPSDYILYMQEDQWPTRKPDLNKLCNIVEQKDLYRLQISPINHFYSLFSEDDTIYFHSDSKYLVSHQPSIWKKSFLLECLQPNETPWVNEYEGTKRLKNNPDIERKIAIYHCNWYDHKCSKGKIIES